MQLFLVGLNPCLRESFIPRFNLIECAPNVQNAHPAFVPVDHYLRFWVQCSDHIHHQQTCLCHFEVLTANSQDENPCGGVPKLDYGKKWRQRGETYGWNSVKFWQARDRRSCLGQLSGMNTAHSSASMFCHRQQTLPLLSQPPPSFVWLCGPESTLQEYSAVLLWPLMKYYNP